VVQKLGHPNKLLGRYGGTSKPSLHVAGTKHPNNSYAELNLIILKPGLGAFAAAPSYRKRTGAPSPGPAWAVVIASVI